jgi:hypothetical protein
MHFFFDHTNNACMFDCATSIKLGKISYTCALSPVDRPGLPRRALCGARRAPRPGSGARHGGSQGPRLFADARTRMWPLTFGCTSLNVCSLHHSGRSWSDLCVHGRVMGRSIGWHVAVAAACLLCVGVCCNAEGDITVRVASRMSFVFENLNCSFLSSRAEECAVGVLGTASVCCQPASQRPLGPRCMQLYVHVALQQHVCSQHRLLRWLHLMSLPPSSFLCENLIWFRSSAFCVTCMMIMTCMAWVATVCVDCT